MNLTINEERSSETQFLKASMTKAVREAQGLQTIEALADHIRHTLPLPHSAHRIELNRQAGVVVFTLYGQQFVATPSLDVFELKGKNLLISAISTLVQAVLAKQEKNSRILETLLDSIEKAEDLLKARRFDRAYALLDSVRQTVRKQHRPHPVSLP